MRRRAALFIVTLTCVMALGVTVALSFCEEGGGGTIHLLITPSSLKYIKVKEVKKFNFEVLGGNEKAIIQDVKTTDKRFKIISLTGGLPHCIGFKLEPAAPVCQEEVELTEYVGGLKAKLEFESTTGLTASAALTT